jgi:hypothetical protein
LRYIVGEKFERDKATERGVLRLVDDTHASAAELTSVFELYPTLDAATVASRGQAA